MTVLLNVSRSFLIVSHRFSAPQAQKWRRRREILAIFAVFTAFPRFSTFLNVSQSFLIVSHMLPRGARTAASVLQKTWHSSRGRTSASFRARAAAQSKRSSPRASPNLLMPRKLSSCQRRTSRAPCSRRASTAQHTTASISLSKQAKGRRRSRRASESAGEAAGGGRGGARRRQEGGGGVVGGLVVLGQEGRRVAGVGRRVESESPGRPAR